MKKVRQHRFWVIFFAIIAVVELIAYIVLASLDIISTNRTLALIFAIVNPLFFVITFASLIFYLNALALYKELKSENLYSLGIVSSFYNYHAFENHVSKLKRFKFRKAKAFVLSFSATNKAVVGNVIRDSTVSKLNGAIARYIVQYFRTHGRKAEKSNSYCFYHGSFIVYSFMDREFVEKLAEDLSDAAFKIAEENQFHVFIQPFIGICEVSDFKQDIYASVDNANIARNYSEENFVDKTYYQEEFRKGATDNEIKEIANAITNNEFVVYYQAKYSLKEKQFVSAEALVRWNSPKYGILAPGKFIQKAELGGIIHEIDMFVFRRVCEDLSETKRRGRRLLPVSVNFSLYEFYAPNFLTDLMNILNEFDIDPKYIEIEITETTSQANSFLAISILKKIKEKGLNILMDDFGIGYSNITNLNKLPIDKVKIDKSFIDNLANDDKTRESVRYLIELCTINGMESIAEGVDDPLQVDILKKIKCDTIQGYYYSKPVPKEEYDRFLQDNAFEKKNKGGNKE